MPLLLRKIVRLMAFALLALSLFFPWLQVPVSIKESAIAGACSITFGEPVSTVIFKAVILGVLLILCALSYWRQRSRVTSGVSPMAIGGPVLLITIAFAYPALTMQRCPEISAHAGWLFTQNYSLIQPDGDAFNAQEYFYQSAQPEVDVKEILPRTFSVLPAPCVSSFSDLHLSKLENVVEWMGLSEPFCEFVRRGWFCGIFGSFLLTLSFMPTRGSETRALIARRGHLIGLSAVGGSLLLCLACLAPVLLAGRQLSEARTATFDGSFSEALAHLDAALAWLPALGYDTNLICQRGWLERKLGLASPSSQVLSAIREEEEGFNSRAARHYADLLEQQRPGPVKEEAYRGALRLALKDFNSGLTDRAANRLKELVEIDSTCIKAYYALQLADLRYLQKERLEQDTAKFEALYNCFQSLEKSSLIANAHRRAAELEFDYRDTGKLGTEMRAAITP